MNNKKEKTILVLVGIVVGTFIALSFKGFCYAIGGYLALRLLGIHL